MTEAPPLHDLEARARWHLGFGYRDPDDDDDYWDGDDDGFCPDDGVCPKCHGDGMDYEVDYLLPCPLCQGEQTT